MADYDVVVVGSGNAGMSAAMSARNGGANTIVIEKAPQESAFGNSRFTGGLFRSYYDDINDMRRLLPDLSEEEWSQLVIPHYSKDDFWRDVMALTYDYADKELTRTYIDKSLDSVAWLADQGVPFLLGGAGAHGKINPGAAVWVDGAGRNLVRREYEISQAKGVEFSFETQCLDLVVEGGVVKGVRVRRGDGEEEIRASNVVLACGGFSASSQRRAEYLGPDWEQVTVRGTPYNTGDMIPALQRAGAQMSQGWTDCHATPMDISAPPDGGDIERMDLARHDYPYGILVNIHGQRFVDEGEDFRLYTYAKMGRALLTQPRALGFQIFDQKAPLLPAYSSGTRYEADTLEDLARQAGFSAEGFVETVKQFNTGASRDDVQFLVRGSGSQGIRPVKSNWAFPIDEPPYLAFPTTCGITFTYGGVRTNTEARVLDGRGKPIRGLFSVGEIQGGLFRHNYPGGCGLMRGTVFGKIAGEVITR